MIFERDLLGADMLLHRHRKVRATFNGRIIGHDHCLVAMDHPDAGDDTRRRRFIVVHAVRRQGAEFEKRSVRIQDRFDALSNEHLAALFVAPDNGFTAALLHSLQLRSKLSNQLQHRLAISLGFGRYCHSVLLQRRSMTAGNL